MVFPIVALVLALPQVTAYLVTRWWGRSGHAEWLGTAVATYSAIWYVTCHSLMRVPTPPADAPLHPCGTGTMIAWGLLGAGLVIELLIGILLAGVVFNLRRSRPSVPPPPAPPSS